MTKTMVGLMLACGVAAVVPRGAVAGALPQPKCAAAKQKAASKEEAGELTCYSKAATKPPLSTDCITKATAKFAPAFTKADAKGACVGDPGIVGGTVDTCVQHLVDLLPVSTGSEKCIAAKLKAGGKAGAAKLGCFSKVVGKGSHCSVTLKQICLMDADCPSGETCILALCPTGESSCDSLNTCLQKATDKLGTALTKADAKGACTGDATDVGATVDNSCVTPVASGLPGLKPGCGNGIIEPNLGETCDDGNTLDGDSCPSTCHVDPCVPVAGTLAASVTYAGPAGTIISGLGVFVDYPEGKVTSPSVTAGFNVSQTDTQYGYGFNDEALKLGGLPKPFIHVTFQQLCQGASAATAADFKCTVTDASDDVGNVVPANQVTCQVTIP
jgi:cysteine-rich repeat protein